jgi:hypothetical protein
MDIKRAERNQVVVVALATSMEIISRVSLPRPTFRTNARLVEIHENV